MTAAPSNRSPLARIGEVEPRLQHAVKLLLHGIGETLEPDLAMDGALALLVDAMEYLGLDVTFR